MHARRRPRPLLVKVREVLDSVKQSAHEQRSSPASPPHNTMPPMIRWVVAVALVAGCQSPEGSAQETFSRANTCPPDRVQAKTRADLNPSSFVNTGTEEPPKDIAADPARLKMWRDERAKRAASSEHSFDMTGKQHIVEVSGCGKHVFYECHLPQRGGGGGPRFWCSEEREVPASVSATL